MKTIYCADLFCGGGGTSTGMIQAFQKAGINFKLIGVNHWKIAVETNKLNHPFEKLYCSTVQNVKPREAVPSGRLHFLWASPECTNHSRAKGGRPRDEHQGKENQGQNKIGGYAMKCDFCGGEFPEEGLETIEGALHDSGDPEVFHVCETCAEWLDENTGRKLSSCKKCNNWRVENDKL